MSDALPLGKVVCGDALEFLHGLPDGCAKAILTDPPYGVDYQTKLSVEEARRVAEVVAFTALGASQAAHLWAPAACPAIPTPAQADAKAVHQADGGD